MAAQPIPRPEDSTEVDIAADGTVTGQVQIKNSGVVKFDVTSYPNGYNTCIITITSANVTWENLPIETENTIKVGSGGGGARGHKR